MRGGEPLELGSQGGRLGLCVASLGLFHGEALLEGTQAPEIKAKLRENTALAAGLGVCGVPTFQVDDGPLFWGQDRLNRVAEALRG